MIKDITLFIKKTFLALIFIPVLSSCATNPVTGQTELMLISEKQEIEIGKSSAPSLEWEFGGKYPISKR
jgi:hypothetical protein